MTRRRAIVLLPTYNEADNIRRLVPAILDQVDVDIMVLDDNSPDGTGAVAESLAAQEPRLSVVHRPHKAGLGAAYLDGFRRALDSGYERILEMDADFSHSPRCLGDLLAWAESYDLVLGSRWVKGGGTRNWTLWRCLLSRSGSLYARTILGVSIRDLTGGFKCFRREVLAALPLDEITTTGYAFQIEMTYRAIRMGFRVKETPITFVDRHVGASKMSTAIVVEAIFGVPRLRLTVGKEP